MDRFLFAKKMTQLLWCPMPCHLLTSPFQSLTQIDTLDDAYNDFAKMVVKTRNTRKEAWASHLAKVKAHYLLLSLIFQLRQSLWRALETTFLLLLCLTKIFRPLRPNRRSLFWLPILMAFFKCKSIFENERQLILSKYPPYNLFKKW